MIHVFREFSPAKKITVSIVVLVFLGLGVALLLQQAPSADVSTTQVRATLTITDASGTRQQQIANLHTMRLTSGDYTIESTVPEGRTVTYSPCLNCTNHSPDSYTYGTRAIFSVPQGSYLDLVWFYPAQGQYPSIYQMVDCTQPGFCREQTSARFAYAPAMVKEDDTYHAFYCSASSVEGLQDDLRYTKSIDGGESWAAPSVAVKASPATNSQGLKIDKSACDPSIVFYDGYYYLYYGNAYETGGGNNQTVISVARSQSIAGPYLKYTERGTWEETPPDPKHIIKPLKLRAVPDTLESRFYGAGQPSVVVKDGKLIMWYLDDSYDTFGPIGEEKGVQHIYMLESTNPVEWEPDQSKRVELGAYGSSDIKYDAARKKFVLFSMQQSHNSGSYVEVRLSDNGVNWEQPIALIPATNIPDYSHNIGVSSDNQGFLLNDDYLIIGFGAPYDLRNNDIRGEWDLYGLFYNFRDAIVAESDRTQTPVATTENKLPIGWLDLINSNGVIFGWTLDPDTPSRSLQVSFSIDKPLEEGGTLIGTTLANLPSTDVTNVTGYTGSHRFQFTIPAEYRDEKDHPVYAYGHDASLSQALSLSAMESRQILSGSPHRFTLAAATPTPSPISATPTPLATATGPTTPSPQATATPQSAVTPTPRPLICRLFQQFCPTPIPTPQAQVTPTPTPTPQTQSCTRILFWNVCRNTRRPYLQ